MQTTLYVYLIMWTMIVLPLLVFNVKRMSVKPFGERRRPKWGFISFVVVFIVLVSAFLFSAYTYTLKARYELAAERYISLHAEYITGQMSYEEYIAKTKDLRTFNADTSHLQDELALDSKSNPKSVKFQIGDWIIPKYYLENDLYPDTTMIDDDNPVFLWYRINDAESSTIFLIKMVWKDANGWQITYHARATEEQANTSEVKNSLPSLINGKWYRISA
jgi:hypothetical protein